MRRRNAREPQRPNDVTTAPQYMMRLRITSAVAFMLFLAQTWKMSEVQRPSKHDCRVVTSSRRFSALLLPLV